MAPTGGTAAAQPRIEIAARRNSYGQEVFHVLVDGRLPSFDLAAARAFMAAHTGRPGAPPPCSVGDSGFAAFRSEAEARAFARWAAYPSPATGASILGHRFVPAAPAVQPAAAQSPAAAADRPDEVAGYRRHVREELRLRLAAGFEDADAAWQSIDASVRRRGTYRTALELASNPGAFGAVRSGEAADLALWEAQTLLTAYRQALVRETALRGAALPPEPSDRFAASAARDVRKHLDEEIRRLAGQAFADPDAFRGRFAEYAREHGVFAAARTLAHDPGTFGALAADRAAARAAAAGLSVAAPAFEEALAAERTMRAALLRPEPAPAL